MVKHLFMLFLTKRVNHNPGDSKDTLILRGFVSMGANDMFLNKDTFVIISSYALSTEKIVMSTKVLRSLLTYLNVHLAYCTSKKF